MRTWAEAAGVPEAVRKQLGRWTPSVDLSYERTTRVQHPLSERMERLGHAKGAQVEKP